MLLELTINSNVTKIAPVVQTYELNNPAIKSIKVNIPDGHKYLARLKIFSRGVQLAPELNAAEFIRGNNNEVIIPVNRAIEGPPYPITLSGWNEDDTYSHTFYIEVNQ